MKCYFDGTHSTVREYTALTLWMLHPALCKVMRLVSMVVLPQSNENMREFWIQWNSMLSETKVNENKFNPSTFMVDQGTTNINTIAAVYGEEGCMKPKTCQ